MVDIAKKIASSEVRHFEPAGDLVLLEVHEAGVTPGGLALPEGYRAEGPQKATVVAVGPGRLLDDGGRGAMACKVGDVVYLALRGAAGKFPKGSLSEDREYVLAADGQITGFYRAEGAGGKKKGGAA